MRFEDVKINKLKNLVPVVQSIVSLMGLLGGQLEVFYDFLTKYTDIFVEKMREAFALQKRLTFFQQNILAYLRYYCLKF